jgi:hypothetical protein
MEEDAFPLLPDEMWELVMSASCKQDGGVSCVMLCMACKQFARVFSRFRARFAYIGRWSLTFIMSCLPEAGTPGQMKWFMDECNITRVAVVWSYGITIEQALNTGNFALADWLLEENIGTRPLLEDNMEALEWFLRHDVVVLASDSVLIRTAYRRYHAHRLGYANPQELQIARKRVSMHDDELEVFMREHFRDENSIIGVGYNFQILLVLIE